MKLDCIYIVCYRGDVHFARPLVASIRQWYPEIQVVLVKDLLAGHFSTRDIEETYRVSVLDTERKRFGWCWAKLEPLFLPQRQRCLILDADIVFAGPVLEALEAYDEDFVVSVEETKEPRSSFMRQTYFDYDALRTFDTSYEYPGFTFNAGQILATSGVVKRDHFAGLVDWRPALPQMVRPDIFSCGDQGIMNYILAAKALKGEITLGKGSFMVWPKSQAAQALELKRVGQGEAGYPFLLHWAGLGHPFSFRKMLLGKWLLHYEAEYYSKIRAGTLKRLTRQTQLWCWYKKCRLKQKLGLG